MLKSLSDIQDTRAPAAAAAAACQLFAHQVESLLVADCQKDPQEDPAEADGDEGKAKEPIHSIVAEEMISKRGGETTKAIGWYLLSPHTSSRLQDRGKELHFVSNALFQGKKTVRGMRKGPEC